MGRKKFKQTTQDIVVMLAEGRLKVGEVARSLGVSRQAIWKRLKHAGIDISGRAWVETKCTFCAASIRRRWRVVARNEDNYCNHECYYADLENLGHKQWRQGSRIARAIVAQYFPLGRLPEGSIVHHKDGDDRNNDRSNLLLLASQADHIRMHRSKNLVVPLWDGATDTTSLRGYRLTHHVLP